jgi:hypothetical protein
MIAGSTIILTQGVQYPCRSPPFLINPYFTLDTLM